MTVNGYVHGNNSRGRPKKFGLVVSKVSGLQVTRGSTKTTGQKKLEESHSGPSDASLDIAKASSKKK